MNWRLWWSLLSNFGRLDVVVSNAGANVFEGAAGCNEEQWRHNLDLNLASHWRLAKYCKPYLEKADEGAILLMTFQPFAFSFHSGPVSLINVTKRL